MIKKISLIGAAIAAMIAAAPAMALPVTGGTAAVDTTPGVVKLVVSGSSAFQSAFESELSSAASTICDNSPVVTYTKYAATVTGGGTAPGLFGYSCTSKAGLLASQKPMIIYYRPEGGSIYGVTPVVRASAQVLRLALNATNCTSSGTSGSCSVGAAYTAATDTLTSQTAAAVDSATDLGLSDEEAGMFTASNYPSPSAAAKLNVAPLTSGLTPAEITTLNANSSGLVLQSFGFFTHHTPGGTGVAAEFNAVGSLSHEVIADIYRGKWSDWNQVPKNDGSNTTVTSSSLPIHACRREAGSGTQVAASVFLHDTNCGGTDDFVQKALGLSGNLDISQVTHATSTGNMRTCLINNAGAIGFISAEADRTGLQMIKINGKGAPTTANNLGVATASGDYGFAYEVVAIKRVGLTGTEPGTVAAGLITAAQDQAKGPTTPNVTFLPAGPNAGIAVFPLDTTTNPGKQPVSCFSRSGNSCAVLADAC